MEIEIDLPFPPSVNRLWRSTRAKKGQYRSAEYVLWTKEAALRVGQVETITGPFEVIFEAQRPDNRRRDLDNLPKAMMDCLTDCKAIEDDSLCQSLTIRWKPGIVKGGTMKAWVKAV